jgi:hypothetical protein
MFNKSQPRDGGLHAQYAVMSNSVMSESKEDSRDHGSQLLVLNEAHGSNELDLDNILYSENKDLKSKHSISNIGNPSTKVDNVRVFQSSVVFEDIQSLDNTMRDKDDGEEKLPSEAGIDFQSNRESSLHSSNHLLTDRSNKNGGESSARNFLNHLGFNSNSKELRKKDRPEIKKLDLDEVMAFEKRALPFDTREERTYAMSIELADLSNKDTSQ